MPSLREALFVSDTDKPYSQLRSADTKSSIEDNVDVKAFKEQFVQAFDGFSDAVHQRLIDNVMSVSELQEQDEIAQDIFARLDGMVLIDKYAAYQVLADQWQMITSDIETIQQDGISAVREVETAYKIVKKNDEELEVPDGLKGRILSFDLVQQEKFQAEILAIEALQARMEAIGSELEELHDGFTDEETEAYCDSEKDNAFDKKAIKADCKPKADVEPETKAKLQQIVKLWDEQTKINKQIKAACLDKMFV